MNNVELGVALRRLRLRSGLTQRELASRMGTTQPAVARVEAGIVSPTAYFLDRFARATGSPLTVTFGLPPTEAESELERRTAAALGAGYEQNPWNRNPSVSEQKALEARGKSRKRFSRSTSTA